MFDYLNPPALALSANSISSANNASMFNAGDVIARDAERVYKSGLKRIFEAVKAPNEQQREVMKTRAESWRNLCEKSFNEELARRASWVPWTVSGPANYPARKMNARADRALEVAKEWSEKREAFINNTLEMLRNAIPFDEILEEYRNGKRRDPISSDDPHAVEKLAARLEGMKETHEKMKVINVYWKKNGTAKGCPGISEEWAASIDEHMNDKRMPHADRPFPSWSLSNSNAEIKRIEQRLKDIQRIKESADGNPEKEIKYNGFSVVVSSQDCRAFIIFDGKPEAPARDILKKNGFHWSPREGKWTRKLTDNTSRTINRYIIPGLLALDEYSELKPEPVEEPEPEAAPQVEPEPAPAPEPAEAPEPLRKYAAYYEDFPYEPRIFEAKNKKDAEAEARQYRRAWQLPALIRVDTLTEEEAAKLEAEAKARWRFLYEKEAAPEPVPDPEPVEAPEPEAAPEPAPAPEPVEAPEAAEPEPAPRRQAPPKPARGPGKPLDFLGQVLSGPGWQIVFDTEAQRTRVIIEESAREKAAPLAEAAGFYYSVNTDSWHKKLSHKAHRAAVALAEKLRAAC